MKPRQQRKLGVESLENRQMMSTASLSNGILTINGTVNSDSLRVYATSSGVAILRMDALGVTPIGTVSITVNGVPQGPIPRSQLTSANIRLGAGSDRLELITDALFSTQVWGGDGNDIVLGGTGRDVLLGEGGNDYLYGAAGNDSLHGHAGNDKLYGGDGDDGLYGSDGNDYLNGQAGNDYVVGEGGTDTFRRSLYFPGFNLTNEQGDQPAEVAGAFLSEVAGSDHFLHIDQAGTNTCAFLSALASVARRTGDTNDLVGRIQYDATRDLYGIKLYAWKDITVDVFGNSVTIGRVPEARTVWVNGDWTEGIDPGGKLWVTLYQKAYIQFKGGVDTSPANALFALTGVPASGASLSSVSFDTLREKTATASGITAGSVDSGAQDGIVANHSYAIIELFKLNGTSYVRLYNPWATDDSNSSTSNSLLDMNSSGTTYKGDDGLITLTWAQFTRNFTSYCRA